MEINMVKSHGTLRPMTEADQTIIEGMKQGEVYRMEYTKPRNYKFLQKYMVLVNDVLFELFKPEPVFHKGNAVVKNRERFRKDLLIATGHYELVVNIKGEVRAEAKSISFAKMEEHEFAQLYSLTIAYALEKIIKDGNHTETSIDNWVNQIISFT